VACASCPSYSGGRDQDCRGSKTAHENSSPDPISTIPNTRKGLVEHLPSKREAQSSNPSTTQKKTLVYSYIKCIISFSCRLKEITYIKELGAGIHSIGKFIFPFPVSLPNLLNVLSCEFLAYHLSLHPNKVKSTFWTLVPFVPSVPSLDLRHLLSHPFP
jgi:hypothetical protein